MSPPSCGIASRDLAFQVEMLLPADLERPFDDVRRLGDGRRRIALLPDDRARSNRLSAARASIDGQERGQFRDR